MSVNYGLLTRFDPFSILMYRKGSEEKGDPIWDLKPAWDQPTKLSELDKLSLIILFPPCIRDSYNPQTSATYGLLSCGREVTENHHQITPPVWLNTCGPYGQNCPACRVFKYVRHDDSQQKKQIAKVDLILKDDPYLWQGLSGMVFCGQCYDSEFFTKRSGEMFIYKRWLLWTGSRVVL